MGGVHLLLPKLISVTASLIFLSEHKVSLPVFTCPVLTMFQLTEWLLLMTVMRSFSSYYLLNCESVLCQTVRASRVLFSLFHLHTLTVWWALHDWNVILFFFKFVVFILFHLYFDLEINWDQTLCTSYVKTKNKDENISSSLNWLDQPKQVNSVRDFYCSEERNKVRLRLRGEKRSKLSKNSRYDPIKR